MIIDKVTSTSSLTYEYSGWRILRTGKIDWVKLNESILDADVSREIILYVWSDKPNSQYFGGCSHKLNISMMFISLLIL